MALNREEWERLEEIRNEMNDLLEQAEYLVRKSGQKFELERARAYWIAGMENYLGEGRLSSQLSGCSMEDTIKALEPYEGEENMDDEDIALANADHLSPAPDCDDPTVDMPLDEQIARERGANTSYDDKE